MKKNHKNQIYLIGNAHLDPVWLWRKSEGLSEILSTYRSALDRMKEFPDYVFTSACAGYYKWVEETDPAMFEEIKERIAEGRWSAVGGFWVQPDCNIPSGEAFARHTLYSQRYFKEKLGVTAKTGYNVDSFGHSGMFPQLLKKSGMDNYVFMRGDEPREEVIEGDDLKGHDRPDLFHWESPDGSRVLAHKVYKSYEETCGYPDSAERCVMKAKDLQEKSAENDIPYMSFYGVGNHGGGPTIRGLRALEPFVEEEENVKFASVDELFDDVRAEGLDEKLPVVKESLLHHASGCYAADSAVKAANRRAENMLLKAEKYDLLSQQLLGFKGSEKRLGTAWEKVLFNQFHDILAGCCIREAYTDALDSFSAACDEAAEITDLALHRISWNIKTTRGLSQNPCQKNGWTLWEKDGEGAPIVVFNPHSFPVKEAVQINITVAGVADSSGKAVPCQKVRGPQTNGSDIYNTIFTAEIPAFGYAVYYIYKDHAFDTGETSDVRAEGCVLENKWIRLTLNKHTGCIESLIDKETGRELAAGAMARAAVIDDHASDTWAHNRYVFDEEIGMFTDAEIQVLENGPVRGAIRVTSRYQNSVLQQDFLLSADAREIKVRCKLDFHEKLKLVKLCFPVAAENGEVIYSMPYGFEAREADGLEQPSHKWMMIKSGEEAGLGLCNDGKYSFSAKECAGGMEMRMDIARGAIYADHYGERDNLVDYQDQGEQYFNYSLVPGTDIAYTVRRSEVLNMQPDVLMETHHEGRLEPVYTGADISSDHVLLTVSKNAEDGKGQILRLVETAGKAADVKIELPFLHTGFETQVGPQEIKTLRVVPESGEITEVLLTEFDE